MMVALAVEEISKVDAAAADPGGRAEHAGGVPAARLRQAERRRRGTCRGSPTDTVGAYALSEAGSGSDAFALATRAERTATTGCSTGRKLWITNGAEAELFIVFANADPDAGYKGITAFIVERDFPGFTVGKKEDKLGIRASSTCELLLDDCRVPDGERARPGRARATRSRSRRSTTAASGSARR